MALVRVPVLGTVGQSVRIDQAATVGATIGADLKLPDGTTPTLAELAIALGVTVDESTGSLGPISPTIWSLIAELPANIVAVEALATAGLVVRRSDGSWVTRTLAAGSAKIVVANGDGDAGAPSVDLGSVALDDLSDATVAAPVLGDVLQYDGAVFANAPLSSSPNLDGGRSDTNYGGTIAIDGGASI
jgi:hypothetical protein